MLSSQTSMFLALLVFFFGLGLTASLWARCGVCAVRAARGRWLYAVTLALVGGLGLTAAFVLHASVLAFGLVAGLLFIAMLWEGPAAAAAN